MDRSTAQRSTSLHAENIVWFDLVEVELSNPQRCKSGKSLKEKSTRGRTEPKRNTKSECTFMLTIWREGERDERKIVGGEICIT